MKVIITETDTLQEVANNIGSVVNGKFFYIPGWFEKDENGDFIFHHMSKLPLELVNAVKEIQEAQQPKTEQK